MNILIVGSGAREHAILKTLNRSPQNPTLFCCGTSNHPGIRALTKDFWIGNICDVFEVLKQAQLWKIDLAVIGPEAPLEKGLADILWQHGIPVVGPKKNLAQIETSKAFTRELLKKYHIPGSLQFQVFQNLSGVKEFLAHLGENNYVIKANGLMGGKGVKVSGDHLHSMMEAYQFCEELIAQKHTFVIEEKCIGEEFSLLSFCDGETLIPMPLVQDHKRAFVNDTGPNTGGMGSYSDANHRLPFLNENDFSMAFEINQKVIRALTHEYQEKYQGILYGSFMATKRGVRVIEFNARFGDPEAMNVLAILESDVVDIFQAIVQGKLTKELVRFSNQATVCKYVVPEGYPDQTSKNKKIDISNVKNSEQLYLAAVDEKDGILYATGSRTAAVVGIADTITVAEQLAEKEIQNIQGDFFHRKDIGTEALIARRISHMRRLRTISLGIMGSTRGTDMQALIDAIAQKKLVASIQLVVSNKENAYILERARAHNIQALFIENENNISDAMMDAKVDLIVLIGYMRILSNDFIKNWENKIINIHPSLLPDFAGCMAREIYTNILEKGLKETGCTVHIVTEKVDAGPILVQKKCHVLASDTLETLKERVQALEGEALIEAIRKFNHESIRYFSETCADFSL